MKTNRILITVFIVGVLLLIPFIAMQFNNEVVWTASDFVIMGILLLVTGLAINMAFVKVSTRRNRFILSAIILFVFLLIWAELAVGIFGTPFAGS